MIYKFGQVSINMAAEIQKIRALEDMDLDDDMKSRSNSNDKTSDTPDKGNENKISITKSNEEGNLGNISVVVDGNIKTFGKQQQKLKISNSLNNLHQSTGLGSFSPKMLIMDDEKSPTSTSRRRTFSAGSQGSLNLNVDCSSSPSPSPRSIGSPAPRVLQIRREESVDELTREVAKERDITSAINLSRSLDETSWLGDKNFMTTNETRDTKRDSMDEILFNPAVSSPVRFVEKLHHNRSLTPSPIGIPISPKQRTYRRSLSPSNLKPSLLSSKRKLDPDDCEMYTPTPAKRPSSSFYSPVSTVSSISSGSSPDHFSDTNLNRYSCDDDSGNENAFLPNVSQQQQQTSLNTMATINSLLSCDTRSTQSYAFVKPRYVAPQSPLAAGVSSASITNEVNRKNIVSCQSYTFTPVKD